MNKTELINIVAGKTGKPITEVKKFLNIVLETIGENLEKGEAVRLTGFGTISVQDIPARIGRNPLTGNPLQIQAKKKVRFKAGTELSGKVAISKK